MIRWQFDMAWSLLDRHLDVLTDADCFWQPSTQPWTVHQVEDGSWVTDWADPEPVPAPAVTIGWLTWHICWWWEAAIAGLHGDHIRTPEQTRWPGSAAKTAGALRALKTRWTDLLDKSEAQPDSRSIAVFPWSGNPDRTNKHVLMWVNTELMKNAAEIGQLQRIRASSETSAAV